MCTAENLKSRLSRVVFGVSELSSTSNQTIKLDRKYNGHYSLFPYIPRQLSNTGFCDTL